MQLRRIFRNIGNIKLTGYFIGFLFLAVFIICILSVDELEKILKGRLIDEGLEINNRLRPTVSRYLDSKNVARVRRLLDNTKEGSKHLISYKLIDPKGFCIASSNSNLIGTRFDKDEISEKYGLEPESKKGVINETEQGFEVVDPVRLGDADYGFLILGFTTESISADIAQFRKRAYLTGLVVFVVSSLIFIYIAHTLISNPLKKVSHNVNRISKGDLQVEDLKVENEDDISTINRGLNEIGALLKNTISGLHTFVNHLRVPSENLTIFSEKATSGMKEQTSKLDQIVNLTNEISSRMQELIRESNKTLDKTLEAIGSISKMGSFSDMRITDKMSSGSENVEDVSKTIGTIEKETGAMENVALSLKQIVSSIQNLSNMMDEVSNSVNDAAIKSREKAEKSEELIKNVQILNGLTIKLRLLLDRFKIGK